MTYQPEGPLEREALGIPGGKLSLYEIVIDVEERTHLGELEILEIIREQWPRHEEFSLSQLNLLVRLIEKKKAAL